MLATIINPWAGQHVRFTKARTETPDCWGCSEIVDIVSWGSLCGRLCKSVRAGFPNSHERCSLSGLGVVWVGVPHRTRFRSAGRSLYNGVIFVFSHAKEPIRNPPATNATNQVPELIADLTSANKLILTLVGRTAKSCKTLSLTRFAAFPANRRISPDLFVLIILPVGPQTE